MSRTDDDSRTIEKVKRIIEERLPGFASRYFNHNMDLKAPRSLYGYALDLASFFQYLEGTGYDIKKMTMQNLERVTPQVIEDYMEYCRTHMKGHHTKKEMSLSGLAHKYSSLSSFFDYYYHLDLIDRNPVHKVAPPKPLRNMTRIPSNDINFELLDYVSNGKLSGRKGQYREHTKERDLAIIMLIMGAGIRISDVVNLNIDDVHLEDNSITVRSRRMTRNVYFSDTISQAIGRYLDQRLDIMSECMDDALFLSLQGKRICQRSVQKMIKKYSSEMFDGKDHLTGKALNLSFQNNIFDQAMNTNLSSAATGNDKKTVIWRYRPYIVQYECQKGRYFNI